MDAALADYERALELDPTMLRATHMLAILRYDRHEFSLAARDLRKVVDLIPGNDYLRFRLFLACSWLGDAKHAAKELQAHLDNRGPTKKSDWTSIVGDFLLGRMPEVGFLKAAENSDAKTTLEQRCEAFYYAGSQRLLKGGETVKAAKYFQASLDTGVKRFTEYGSARIELNLLKASVHE